MQLVNKLMMLSMNVSDMPKAKAFYADKLGLKVTTDYRKDDDNWWVSLALPKGGATITLSRATGFENMKPGTMTLYFETSDIVAAHKELSSKGVKVSEVQDDLFGTGSGVKWFNLEDPDGNQVILAQAHKSRAPF
jgi:catechol 2,3-dioxygenase-like lactoylglutathione lyase family enzyme